MRLTKFKKTLTKGLVGIALIIVIWMIWVHSHGISVYVTNDASGITFISSGFCYPGNGHATDWICFTTTRNPSIIALNAGGSKSSKLTFRGNEAYTSILK